MNLANKLTICRVVLIPFFLMALYLLDAPYSNYIAAIIFVIASLTDLLDGYIARSKNLITNFGKFMDPLADKLLVAAALIYFVESGQLSAWIVIIIISREFIVSGFRLVASMSGVVLAAGWWGKVKTAITMIMIIVLMVDLNIPFIKPIELILIALALIFTIISALDYVLKNINIFHE